MKTRFMFDLQAWDLYRESAITNITFTNCENLTNIEEGKEFKTFIINRIAPLEYSVTVIDANNVSTTYTQDNIFNLVALLGIFYFDADVSGINVNGVLTLLNYDLVFVNQNGRTTFLTFRQNDTNNTISKKLNGIGIFDGEFRTPINYKTNEIDVSNYNDYNFVYIPLLKRYYYVRTPTRVTNELTRIYLIEDHLMSWDFLIRHQGAFITRYSGATNDYLVDDRLPLEDVVTISYDIHTNTPSGTTKVNTSFDFTYNGSSDLKKDCRFLVGAITYAPGSELAISGVSDTTLPSLNATHSRRERYGLVNAEDLGNFTTVCMRYSNYASYVMSIIALPFNPENVFSLDSVHEFLWVNDKFLSQNQDFTDDPNEGDACLWKIKDGTCPYIIIADFTIADVTHNKFLRRRPRATLEIYVPFVGWVDLNPELILGKRIIIYYTLEFKSGMASAYIYNVTQDKLVWSGACQLGIKCDLTTSNINENTKQKQANDLNMVVGLVASAVSIGIGAYTGNAVGVVGGVLSAGKTIASNVNQKSLIFDKAQTSLGSSDNSIHTQLQVHTRLTYHDTIISEDNATYLRLNGKPYNMYIASMDTLTGYVEVGDISFDPKGWVIYQDEIAEIVALLKSGVIL